MSFTQFAHNNYPKFVENFLPSQIDMFTKIFSHFSYASQVENFVNKENTIVQLKKMMQEIASSQDLLIRKFSAGDEIVKERSYTRSL